MATYLYIGLGGCLGALARYVLANYIAVVWGMAFPYGTLLINVSGSFVLCFLQVVFSRRAMWPQALHLAITIGFLGAYTTFSTFSYEWLRLLQSGQGGLSVLYVVGSVLAGGVAGGLGLLLGRLL